MPRSQESADPLSVANYVVAFVDLLGQRAALRGQGLLLEIRTPEQHAELLRTLRASVGSISSLQKRADDFVRASEPTTVSPLRAMLSADKHQLWDELRNAKVTTQRWSDGLMLFSSLGDKAVRCHMSSVYRLFALTGSLCFITLAAQHPLRGALELAWGVELHPDELYGAAVARAYELESEVADYPRIVVGQQLLHYLELQTQNPGTEPQDQIGKVLAELCLQMVVQDADGHWLLHYLGPAFTASISRTNHVSLYEKALAFVQSQLEEHQRTQNTKLAFRYMRLHQYFSAHPPSNSGSEV
jgi:hypothetical protein